MFGGLDLKGSGKDEEEAKAPAASAFGFLNPSPETAPAEPAAEPTPASSAFSFLNAAPSPEPEPSAPSTGFDFLKPDTPTETEPASAESGFSFMTPSEPSEPAPAPVTEDPPMGTPADIAEPPGSGFSFLSTPSATVEDHGLPDLAPVAPTSTPSVVSAPSPTPEETPAFAPPSLPAGAGVTFGTAAGKKPVVRKKKTRAQKVGVGATAAAPPPPPAPRQAPVPRPAPAPSPPKPASPPKETRDGAADAQRRAEEFMQQKTMQEAIQRVPSREETPPLHPTLSTDEEVAEAKRAAQEAQKMASTAGKGGFMGTFFKGFGGSNSSLGSKNSSGHGTKGPRPSPPSSNNLAPGTDRLTKQQQEMNRAAAEREMKLQQQNSKEEDNEEQTTTAKETITSAVSTAASAAANFATNNLRPSSFESTSSNKAPAVVVREVQPPQTKEKTPMDIFEEYQSKFADSVHHAMHQVHQVRSQQNMLEEERFVAFAKQRLCSQQIEQAEAQLQVAVEEEDYELADQLGQVVDAHNREKAELASMLESIAKGLNKLDSQKTTVVQGVATCFQDLALQLKELQEQEISKDRDSDPETLKQFASISKQLSTEQERLQQDLKHLERDEQLVAEERKELERSISEQSGEYEKQRDNVKDQLETIENEIVELRKQVESKIKIAAGLRTEMHGLDDNVSKVRVKFSRQLTRVDKKERSVQENRVEWQAENSTFKSHKESHELQVQTHSEALLAHDALLKTLEDELKLCQEFAGVVPTKLDFSYGETKAEKAEDAEAEGDLAQLQADVVKCEAAFSEAKIMLKAATSAIASLESEHATLIATIPQLEGQKKSAAAKRDFKAASKASKQIKDSTARLKECEEELTGDAAEKKSTAEAELKRLDAELGACRAVAQEKEKVSGIAKMEAVAKQIEQLVVTKKELCGETTSKENTVVSVGAFVLEGQIQALKEEGEALGGKYGGWSELMNGIFSDGAGEDEPAKTEAPPEVDEKPAEAPAAAPVDDGRTSEERVLHVRNLIARIQQAEESLDAAAQREDYDEAAELQEVFENLQMELENISLTDEESELAFADEPPTPAAEPKAEEGETAEEAAVEENPSMDGVETKETQEEENPSTDEVETQEESQEDSSKAGADDEANNEAPKDTNEEAGVENGDAAPAETKDEATDDPVAENGEANGDSDKADAATTEEDVPETEIAESASAD